MSSISIIGLGTMARAIAGRAVAAGVDVQVVGRDADRTAAFAAGLGATPAAPDAPLTGDLVVLAVPFAAAGDVLAGYGDALAGKVVVDVTNPFDPSMSGLVTPADSSAAQELARSVPAGTPVIKAFNTLFAANVAAGEVDGRPVDVFVAGDDEVAKKSVTAFVEAVGLVPRDTGGLAMARWLEGAGLLLVAQAVRTTNFSLALAVIG